VLHLCSNYIANRLLSRVLTATIRVSTGDCMYMFWLTPTLSWGQLGLTCSSGDHDTNVLPIVYSEVAGGPASCIERNV